MKYLEIIADKLSKAGCGLAGTVDDYPDALISDGLVLKLWPKTALEATAVGDLSSAPRFISRAGGGLALDR